MLSDREGDDGTQGRLRHLLFDLAELGTGGVELFQGSRTCRPIVFGIFVRLVPKQQTALVRLIQGSFSDATSGCTSVMPQPSVQKYEYERKEHPKEEHHSGSESPPRFTCRPVFRLLFVVQLRSSRPSF